MRYKIENLDELNDSRQVMEASPHKFTSIFIYILLAVIIAFILWACFSEKEVVIKVSGIVKPIEQSYVVSNQIAGEIKSVYLKTGQTVKKDEVLYTTDDASLQIQKSKSEDQKKYLTNDINSLEKLSKGITSDTNYFKNNKEEKEYYTKYKNYETSNKVLASEKTNLINSKNDSNSKMNYLKKLSKSIEANKNYNEKDSIYSQQFNNYKISKKSIEDKIYQLEKSKTILKTQKNSNEAISQIDAEIKNNNNGLIKLESDIKLQVSTSINELESKVKSSNSDVTKFDEETNLSKEKNKITLLAQIEEKLTTNNEKMKEINLSLKEINKNISKCEVKSNIAGKLDIKANLEPGLMIQSGELVAKILPESNDCKVELIIPDKDVGNIKEGQEVKYSFTALPYNEYGFLKGSLDNIGVNSQIDDKSGVAFYTGEGILKNNILYNHKNEKAIIKPGMTCEARIITRRKNMIYYLLEKLNLKD